MMNKDNKALKKLAELFGKGKYILLVVLAGVFLMLLPTGGERDKKEDTRGGEIINFSVSEQERRISQALSEISGAGKVTVVLTLRSSSEQVIATDKRVSEKTPKGENGDSSAEYSEEAVVVTAGSQTQIPVTLKYMYPEYQGALVVAEGAGDAEVRLELMRAVKGLTGLGTDKITVTKMKVS